jgi:hydroxyacylglutathione hydrolase
MFDIIRIPAFKDNYIWLLRKGTAAVVVDPGDARPVIDVLKREALTLAAILVTHHHADHQGGIADLLAYSALAAGSASGGGTLEVFGPASESITALNRPLRGGETIVPGQPCGESGEFGEFAVIAVPGHTLGHLAYYANGCLFCGDTLFGAGCGRLFEGAPAQMLDSLRRLAAFPEATAVYCAHEYTAANLRFALAVDGRNEALRRRADEVAALRAVGAASVPSTLALERATNPFLRCREPALIAAARRYGATASDELTVFTALREWKNTF